VRFLLILIYLAVSFFGLALSFASDEDKPRYVTCNAVVGFANYKKKRDTANELSKYGSELQKSLDLGRSGKEIVDRLSDLHAYKITLLRSVLREVFKKDLEQYKSSSSNDFLLFGEPKRLALQIIKALASYSTLLNEPSNTAYVESIEDRFSSLFVNYYQRSRFKELKSNRSRVENAGAFFEDFDTYYTTNGILSDVDESSEDLVDRLELLASDSSDEEDFVLLALPQLFKNLMSLFEES